MKCDRPGCDADHDELYPHARCHPASPLWARTSEHSLTLECAECGADVMTYPIGLGIEAP